MQADLHHKLPLKPLQYKEMLPFYHIKKKTVYK